MKLVLVAVFVLFIFALSSSSQDFDYGKYKPRTLSELIALNPIPAMEKSEKKSAYISGEWFHSAVRLKYIGTSRPLSAERREILNNWKVSFKMPEELVKLFQNEFLFKECDKDYWLAVQQPVSSYFAKELKEGDMITTYLFLGGGLRTKTTTEWLFLVNEFEK